MPREHAPIHIDRTFCDREKWKKSRKNMEESYVRGLGLYETSLQIFGMGLRLTGLETMGKRIAMDIQVHEHNVYSPTLPLEFDGFKILQISDPHFDVIEGLDDRITEACQKAGPVDICVLTGDFRLADDGPHQQIIPSLEKLVANVQASHGMWAILGNHDDHYMIESFEALGIQCLVNEHVYFSKGKVVLQMVGLDDVNKYETSAAHEALAEKSGDYSIALVHSPDFAYEVANAGYDLYLSGHTHGGQICLPGGKPLIIPLKKGHEFAIGEWQCAQMQGITSSGAGVSGLPVRFFSKSEVNLINLKRRG